jgi:hypothetical protein
VIPNLLCVDEFGGGGGGGKIKNKNWLKKLFKKN